MKKTDLKNQVANIVINKLDEIIKREQLTQGQVGNMLGWKQPLVSNFLRMTINDKYFNKFSTDQVFHVAEIFKIEIFISDKK